MPEQTDVTLHSLVGIAAFNAPMTVDLACCTCAANNASAPMWDRYLVALKVGGAT